MNKYVWIAAAVAVAVLGAGTIYAMKANDATLTSTTTSGSTAKTSLANITVPQGTSIPMRLQSTISTKTAQVGDRFQANVSAPVHVSGVVAIPEGSRVSGHVILARQPGKASGRGELQ